MGQNRVTFDGIQLGLDYNTFKKELKAKGFATHLERIGEASYGVCKEGFFVGKVDGNAAAVRVMASRKTGTVFSVEVNLREFIDGAEAAEEANRLISDEMARVPVCETEDFGMNIAMIDMPGGKNHVTRYICYPVGNLILLFYESRQKAVEKCSYGEADFGVYENSLKKEYIVHIRYYDIAAGRLAEDESGKNNS